MEITISLNIIGIVFQIIGFVLLLSQFKTWLSESVNKKAVKSFNKHSDKQNQDLNKDRKLPLLYRIWSTKLHEKIPAWVGIIMVIVGLFFQLISISIENFL